MLRWRLFGIDFCIQPWFWVSSALFGYLVVGMGMRKQGVELLQYIGFWILCTFVSIMVHELGHAVTGRIFGVPGNITLAGMGGAAMGNFDALRSWQRTLVILAGPGAGFLFLFLLALVNQRPWNMHVVDPLNLQALRIPWQWDLLDQIDTNLKSTAPYAEIMKFLCWMNLVWNLFNLIPIMPLDGGMLLKEGCTLVLGPIWGLRLVFGFSFLLAGSIACYFGFRVRTGHGEIDIFALMMTIMVGMMAIRAFFSMLQVRADPQDEPAPMPRRYPRTAYHDPD